MPSRITLIILLIPTVFISFSQQVNLDSLKELIETKVDTSRINQANKITSYLSTRLPDSALLIGYKSLAESKTLNYHHGLAEAYNSLGTVWIEKSEFDSAISYFNNAIKFYQETDNQRGEAMARNNIGYVERSRGNFESAADSFLAAIELNEKIGSEDGLASNYINLGIVFSKLEQVETALQYYRRAIPIALKLGKDQSLGNIYNNIGIEFRKKNELDSSLRYSKLAIKYRKKANALRDLAGSYNGLGILYFYLNKRDSTLILFNDVLATYEQLGNVKEIARTHYNIAELHRMERRFPQSEQSLKLSLQFAKEAKSKEQIRDALLGLARVYASSGKYQLAYEHRLEFETYQDSLLNERNSKSIAELSEKYESEKKDKQITELELEQQTAALALAQSNNQRNVLIAFLTIITVATVLLYVFFRQKRKSLAEKELLLKEIHHRVKNNLQVISSLLNLQADSLGSKDAKDAVMEGQYRVKSMALIHQKLYSTDDVRGVDLQDYLENLSSELFRAFGIDQEKINWEVKTSGLKLDIDTVIPLGLIINELITNALKYAFKEVDKGLLQIQMMQEGENLNVLIKDNGIGMDAEQIERSNSFGWRMIKSLCRKLKAEIAINNDDGTQVSLILSRFKLVT